MPAAEAVPVDWQRAEANLDERGRAMTRLRAEAPIHRRNEAPPPFPRPSSIASPRGARQIGCYDRPAALARSKEGRTAAAVRAGDTLSCLRLGALGEYRGTVEHHRDQLGLPAGACFYEHLLQI